MATEREGKYSLLQVAKIYLKAGIAAIINVGSILKYESGPVFTSVLDIPHIGYVQNLISCTSIPFTAGDPNPLVISNWQTTYANTYGNGKFWYQYKDGSGNIIDKYDALITRTIDRTTPGSPVQTDVSIDIGIVAYDGQIIIEYSNNSTF